MREKWTDERLDDLNKKVDDGFAETRSEFRAVRGEIGALHRVMMQMFAGLWLTMILGFAGLFTTMLLHF
jgi:tetrahydromethanopterin S-methyltransferase subunit G